MSFNNRSVRESVRAKLILFGFFISGILVGGAKATGNFPGKTTKLKKTDLSQPHWSR